MRRQGIIVNAKLLPVVTSSALEIRLCWTIDESRKKCYEDQARCDTSIFQRHDRL